MIGELEGAVAAFPLLLALAVLVAMAGTGRQGYAVSLFQLLAGRLPYAHQSTRPKTAGKVR